MLCGDLNGKEMQGRGHIYVHMRLIHFTVQHKLTHSNFSKRGVGWEGIPGSPVARTLLSHYQGSKFPNPWLGN